ncbi:MAG: penicillin-binding transpeptidase domain-containing protein, partial [Gallicola sp.]|nr:penicillin-binding transpeptidase domain-containing protein [Gallicola sp.]
MKNYNKKRNSRDKITKSRVTVLFLFCLLLGFVFFIRLFQLQIAGGEIYRKEAQIQKTKTIDIPASRGAIYDRDHNILAQNVKQNTVYISPQSIKDEEKEEIAQSLSSIINIDKGSILEKMEEKKPVKLATGLMIDQVQAIYKLIEEKKYNSISINTETNRFYPNGKMASYLLGFTDFENKGVYGVENTFDKELRGTPGKNILYGRAVPQDQGNLFEPTAGKELSLTIDYKIQTIINKYGEEAMKKFNPKKMAIIVMDPKTGEVLGLENFPKYDPNNPRIGRTEEEQKQLEEMNPEERTNHYYDIWRSFSINDTYEPGSVFKAITASVALEEKTTKEDSKYVCNGFIDDIPGVKIRCHRWYDPHGDQTLSEALNNSCNPAFVQIIREIGKEKFYKYLSGFGFGERTGVKLPGEENGLIPKNVDSIGEAELATMSYGHGLSVTPIQMITAMNAIVNGGYVLEPKLVLSEDQNKEEKEVNIENNKNIVVKRQVISQETSKKMNELLYSVINEGTGRSVSIPGYKIGGKSGTSIKLEDGKYKDNKTDASFFVSYPVENPKYTILVVVDEPQGDNGGNTVAGPVARNILEDIIKDKKYPADYNQDEEIA